MGLKRLERCAGELSKTDGLNDSQGINTFNTPTLCFVVPQVLKMNVQKAKA